MPDSRLWPRPILLCLFGVLGVAGCTQTSAPEADAVSARVDSVAPRDIDAAALDDEAAGAAAPNVGAGPSAQPVYRQFRDVVVACDNVRHCAAIGVTHAASGLVLSLARDAGATGAQHLVLRAPWGKFDATALRLDDAPAPEIVALPWRHEGGEAGEWEALHLEDPAAIAHFIDLVRDGALLDAGADRRVSLAGLSAALLYIDDHQQRLDTAGAWLRRGERADTGVPAAPSLPVLPPAPPAPPALDPARGERLARQARATQTAVLDAQECEPAGGAYDVARLDTVTALDDTHALVLLACFAGAYQHSSLAFRAALDGRRIEPLVLPGPPMREDSMQHGDFDLLTSPGYDPDTGTLGIYARGRGIGDCGFSAEWRFDGQAFALARFVEMDQCGGLMPDHWPVLWRVADASATP